MWNDCVYMMYVLQKFSSCEFRVKEKKMCNENSIEIFLFFMQISHIWQF